MSSILETGHVLPYGAKPDQRHAAVRAVCALARDAADAALLLDVLGLEPSEGRRP